MNPNAEYVEKYAWVDAELEKRALEQKNLEKRALEEKILDTLCSSHFRINPETQAVTIEEEAEANPEWNEDEEEEEVQEDLCPDICKNCGAEFWIHRQFAIHSDYCCKPGINNNTDLCLGFLDRPPALTRQPCLPLTLVADELVADFSLVEDKEQDDELYERKCRMQMYANVANKRQKTEHLIQYPMEVISDSEEELNPKNLLAEFQTVAVEAVEADDCDHGTPNPCLDCIWFIEQEEYRSKRGRQCLAQVGQEDAVKEQAVDAVVADAVEVGQEDAVVADAVEVGQEQGEEEDADAEAVDVDDWVIDIDFDDINM